MILININLLVQKILPYNFYAGYMLLCEDGGGVLLEGVENVVEHEDGGGVLLEGVENVVEYEDGGEVLLEGVENVVEMRILVR